MARRLVGPRAGFASAFAITAVMLMLTSPVAAAQSGWQTFTGSVFNSCTGEVIDNGGTDHSVVTNGFVHENVHYVGTGESSGATYVGDNEINVPAHPSAGGTFTTDFTVTVNLVSTGGASNLRLTFSDQQVFDSSGNLISETTSFSIVCPGS